MYFVLLKKNRKNPQNKTEMKMKKITLTKGKVDETWDPVLHLRSHKLTSLGKRKRV